MSCLRGYRDWVIKLGIYSRVITFVSELGTAELSSWAPATNGKWLKPIFSLKIAPPYTLPFTVLKRALKTPLLGSQVAKLSLLPLLTVVL